MRALVRRGPSRSGIVKTFVVSFDSAMSPPSTRPPLYKGYRFPPQIISHGVWLYYRFAVSLRDVSELLLARGIEVSHEAVRLWTVRFGLEYARRLRRTRGPCSNVWHLDELGWMINGKRGWLWRAVDDAGEVLDILVQRRRSARAAKHFFRKLLKGLRMVPRAIVTDRLASYAAAKAAVLPSVAHLRHLAPEQSGRELTPTGPPARARSATVQEPPPRGALLFRFQHRLQPISTRPPCAFRLELSDRDAPAVAGMGRRLRDDGVRGLGVKSRSL